MTGRQILTVILTAGLTFSTSTFAADGKIYCINEEGQVVVIPANDEQFRIISRVELESEPCRASIAIAEGHLFIHTAEYLYCVGK